MKEHFSNLSYFTEWGGRSWENLMRSALRELQKNDRLNGADLLEIGTGYGKTAVLFSMMGAKVTGIDIHERPLSIAREEAKKWNVTNVNFMSYDGNLDIFPDESFDIIFTKSVLVVVPNLEVLLRSISRKLRPLGRVVFLENGKGNALLHALRALRHRNWDYSHINYFTDNEVRLVQSIFHINLMKRTSFPPVYLFVGQKRA